MIQDDAIIEMFFERSEDAIQELDNKAFVISLEGGTASYSIDISSLPAGKYNVIVVHQGKYDPVVNGAISYHFSKK